MWKNVYVVKLKQIKHIGTQVVRNIFDDKLPKDLFTSLILPNNQKVHMKVYSNTMFILQKVFFLFVKTCKNIEFYFMTKNKNGNFRYLPWFSEYRKSNN